MTRKRLTAGLLLTLLLAAGFAYASGAPGTAGDPVVTLDYIQKKFTPSFFSEAAQRTASVYGPVYDKLAGQLNAIYDSGAAKTGSDEALAEQVLRRLETRGGDYLVAATPQKLTLKLGDVIRGKAGTQLTLLTGSLKIESGGTVVNMTAGFTSGKGASMWPISSLLLDTDGMTLRAVYDTELLVTGSYRVVTYTPQYTALADSLKAMGLFQGTARGYELNRPATRLEALVMMIRLLSEEQAALAYTGDCPFADVPNWGKPYVAYAYNRGLTKGVSATAFDSETAVTIEQYISFVLRALGYTDEDFSWDKAPAFSNTLGLYTSAETDSLRDPFYRDQVVYISYHALDGALKSGGTLKDKLSLGY